MATALNFNNKAETNWVRAAYGLKILKNGLEGFIDRHIKQQHEETKHRLENDTRNPAKCCALCTCDNLLPNHQTRQCIQKIRSQCFCSTSQNRRKCPNQFCSRFYDEIVYEHAEANPRWQNTDPSRWYSDHWELAKCFLGTTGYLATHSASETDVTGLLSIAINDIFIVYEIDNIDNFKTAREIRNDLFHNKMFKATDEEVEVYINRMAAVLQDKTHLLLDNHALQAVDYLNKLKQNKIFISTEDAEELRQNALASIKEVTDKSKREIEHIKLTTIREIELNANKSKTELRSTAKILSSQITQDVQKRQQFSSDNISGLRHYLTSFYRENYCRTDISPLIPEEDVDVDEVYVPVKLEGIYKDSHETVPIETVKQLLCVSTTGSFKIIFLYADVGLGKTTICKRLVSLWCHAHTKSSTGMKKLRLAEEVSPDYKYCYNFGSRRIIRFEVSRNTDIESMLTFDFLFAVSLRYANDEMFIEEMIQSQLYFNEAQSNVFRYIINSGRFKCLVIVDGLDEWNVVPNKPKSPYFAQELPRRKTLGYTVLYTTRPWKTAESKIKTSEISLKVYCRGFEIRSSRNLVSLLEQTKRQKKDECRVQTFLSSVAASNNNYLIRTPLQCKMLHALWEKHTGSPKSQCRLYCEISELMFQYTFERNETDFQLLDAISELKGKSNYVRIPLPKCFYNLPNICGHIYLINLVSVLAFKLYFKTKESPKKHVTFTKGEILGCGLTIETFRVCLKIGLLTQQRAASTPTSRESAISFTNLSFQEFFAAVYIALHPTDNCLNMLRKICKDLSALLHLSNVLRFVYGMYSPVLQRLNNLLENIIAKHGRKIKENLNKRNISRQLLINLSLLYSDCTFENKFSGTACIMDFQFLYLSHETSVSIAKSSSIIRPKHLYCNDSDSWMHNSSIQLQNALCDILCRNSDRLETLRFESIDVRGCVRLQAMTMSLLSSLTLYNVKMDIKQVKSLLFIPTLRHVSIKRLKIYEENANQAHSLLSKRFITATECSSYNNLIWIDDSWKKFSKNRNFYEETVPPMHTCSNLDENVITFVPKHKTVNSLKSLILLNADTTSFGELFLQSLPCLEHLELRNVIIGLEQANGILTSPQLQSVNLRNVTLEIALEEDHPEEDIRFYMRKKI